jgi:hypothetical protein
VADDAARLAAASDECREIVAIAPSALHASEAAETQAALPFRDNAGFPHLSRAEMLRALHILRC